MKELRTEIEIHATPERVWAILTDLDKYPQWNPLFHHAQGRLEMGGQVDATYRTGKKDTTLHCAIVTLDPARSLAWKYHVLLPGLWSGVHTFTIEPLWEGGVLFHDVEVFTGLLVPLMAHSIDTDTRRSFRQMDQALKARAERGEPPDAGVPAHG